MRYIMKTFPVFVNFLRREIASGNPYNFELRLRRFDGEYGGLRPAGTQFGMTPGASRAGTVY